MMTNSIACNYILTFPLLLLIFKQHHTYRKRYKAWASEGPNLGQRGGRSQTFTVPPAETGFVPLALQACLAVLAQDSSRETRRQAALTLNNALRGLPPRLTARAISRGEPLRCIAWDDEEALSAAPLKAKMRNNRLAVRVARGALAKRVIEDWWSLLVDGCGDEELRAELVGAWNFVFAQALEEGASSVPAVLRAHVSKGCDMDVDARSDELGTASNQSALAAKLHLPEDCVAAHETDLHAIFFAASRHLQVSLVIGVIRAIPILCRLVQLFASVISFYPYDWLIDSCVVVHLTILFFFYHLL